MRYIFTLVLLFGTYLLAAQHSNTNTQDALCLQHATLVDVKNGKLIPDQHVIIENGRIKTIGPAKKIRVPADIPVLDCSGKYLMPGMTDAHIHFFQSGSLYTRPDALDLRAVYPYEKDQQWIKDNLPDLMARYLACGITTVVDVGGPFSNYAIRKKLENDTHAPVAWVTGPLVSTYQPDNLDEKDPPIIKVSSPEEARTLVRKQLPYQPDFIKIWYILRSKESAAADLPIVQAAIEESHAHGIRVAVHATEHQTALLAVKAGADMLVHSVDDQVLNKEMLQLMAQRKVAYIPTLTVLQNYKRTFSQQFAFTSHDFAYANPFALGTVMDIAHLGKALPFNYKALRTVYPVPGKEDSIMAINLKLAQDAGVLVVAGTDAGNIGTQHGASFYHELLAMQKAGLTNKQILQAATINAAKAFGKDSVYGSIEPGKWADLLVLNNDPFQDVNIAAHLHTVIRHGKTVRPDQLLPVSPEILAQQQLNAYNARDLEAFLAPYSDSVKIYRFPNQLMMQGKEAMRQQYGEMFKRLPDLHCRLVSRMVQGNTVIDQESVTGMGDKPVSAIAIYQVEKGKIVTVTFIQ
jgi:imidazolonepropionase-like amidohydrolase